MKKMNSSLKIFLGLLKEPEKSADGHENQPGVDCPFSKGDTKNYNHSHYAEPPKEVINATL